MDPPVQDVWFQWHHTVPVTHVWLLSLKGSRESGVAWLWSRGQTCGPCAKEGPGPALTATRAFFSPEIHFWVWMDKCSSLSEGVWLLKMTRACTCIHCLLSGPEDLQESPIFQRLSSASHLLLSTSFLPAALITPSLNPPDAPLAQPLCFSCWMSIIISLSHTTALLIH